MSTTEHTHDHDTTTNITPAMSEAFNAIASGEYNNFALFSCFVNGTPTAAIVAIGAEGDQFTVTPLFVWVTPDLVLTDHDGVETTDQGV